MEIKERRFADVAHFPHALNSPLPSYFKGGAVFCHRRKGFAFDLFFRLHHTTKLVTNVREKVNCHFDAKIQL